MDNNKEISAALTVLEKERNERLAKCKEELEAILKKYGCKLTSHPILEANSAIN